MSNVRFERMSVTYTCEPGVEYAGSKRKQCIKVPNRKTPITLQEAIDRGFVRVVSNESGSRELFDHAPAVTQLQPSNPPPSPIGTASSRALASPSTSERIASDVESTPPDSVASRPPRALATDSSAPVCSSGAAPTIVYLPLDSIRAQVFLQQGLIYPVVYDQADCDRSFHDIQNTFPDSLITFPHPVTVEADQLLFKLCLSRDEALEMAPDGAAWFLNRPLPISRLLAILVPASAGPIDRYVSGWMKPDVPVPAHLFQSTVHSAPVPALPTSPPSMPSCGESRPSTRDGISRYDRYMGFIAYLRNVGRYFSAKTGVYADYPELFFKVCSALRHSAVKPACPISALPPVVSMVLNLSSVDNHVATSVLELVCMSNPLVSRDDARKVANDIYKASGESAQLGAAFKALFAGDYRGAVEKLSAPDTPIEARILTILYHFSNRQNNDRHNVKERIHEDWPSAEVAAIPLALLGARHGYASMYQAETDLAPSHPLLCDMVPQHPDIKFHLRTIFERQLVDLVYAHAFGIAPATEELAVHYADAARPRSESPTATTLAVSVVVSQQGDLAARTFKVTRLGGLLARILAYLGRRAVDDQSILGRYLLAHRFFLADTWSIQGGRDMIPTVKYRMTAQRFVDVIASGELPVDEDIVESILDKCAGS